MSRRVQETPLVAISPIRHAAAAVGEKLGFRAGVAARTRIIGGIEPPPLASGNRIEGDELRARQRRVNDAVDYERIALHLTAAVRPNFAGAVSPGRRELGDVRSVDLGQG